MIHIYRWFSCIFLGKTYTTAISLISLRAHSGPLSELSSTSRLRSSSICCGWPSGRRISVQNPCWLMISWEIHSIYWGLEYSKNGEPLNINQPGLHGMKEDDRGILNSSYDSIMFNGESLGMWVCHHAINHPWLGMFFWHLSVVMWGLVYEIVLTHKRRITPNN